MNRRDFLKSLFAAGVLAAVDIEKATEQLLVETVNMGDWDFVVYVNHLMNLYVENPASIARIDGIG